MVPKTKNNISDSCGFEKSVKVTLQCTLSMNSHLILGECLGNAAEAANE
jgi:hypothetical protein